MLVERLKQYVNVIRHHAPGEQPVPHLVEMFQRLSSDPRDLGLSQPACTRACIQSVLHFSTRQSRKPHLLVTRKRPPHRAGSCHNVSALEIDPATCRFGKRISEAERHKLNRIFTFPMRQAASAANVDHGEIVEQTKNAGETPALLRAFSPPQADSNSVHRW